MFSFISSIIAIIVSIPIAYTINGFKFRFLKEIFKFLFTINIAIPDLIMGLLLLYVYGRNNLLLDIFHIKFIDTSLGIITAMLYISIPYTINLILLGFESTSKILIDEAYALGSTEFQLIKYVYLPHIWKYILRAFIISMMYCISAFGVIIVLAYYPVLLTTKIFQLFQQSDIVQAIQISYFLIITSIFLYVLNFILEWFSITKWKLLIFEFEIYFEQILNKI